MNRSERRGWFERETAPLLRPLYSTALRMTGQPAAAEDLVQETLLKAYRNLGSFQAGTNFRAWVFRILTNTYINEYRRRLRAPQSMDFTEVDPGEPDREPRYFSMEDIGQFREHVGTEAARAIAKIPPEFRVVFLLVTLGDFSYREVSEILEVPVGTVMSRLFRARRILRDELFEYAEKEGYLRRSRA